MDFKIFVSNQSCKIVFKASNNVVRMKYVKERNDLDNNQGSDF